MLPKLILKKPIILNILKLFKVAGEIMVTVTLKRIHKNLESLKKEIVFIKKHMFDPDTIMSSEESRRFEQSMKELKEGKTTTLSELKKELRL